MYIHVHRHINIYLHQNIQKAAPRCLFHSRGGARKLALETLTRSADVARALCFSGCYELKNFEPRNSIQSARSHAQRPETLKPKDFQFGLGIRV